VSSDTNYATLHEVLTEHKPEGWAIEFGVYTGHSLRMIAAYMPVIGLDSFDGLPEDWRPGFSEGKFNWRGPLPHCSNAMIVPGLFADTLPWLRDRGLPNFGLVHIDCDLYSSTVTALNGVIDHIDVGTIVVFDEFHSYPGWEDHESKAWAEFCIAYGIDFTAVAYGPQEAAFRIDRLVR
jgi:hypothetical protein